MKRRAKPQCFGGPLHTVGHLHLVIGILNNGVVYRVGKVWANKRKYDFPDGEGGHGYLERMEGWLESYQSHCGLCSSLAVSAGLDSGSINISAHHPCRLSSANAFLIGWVQSCRVRWSLDRFYSNQPSGCNGLRKGSGRDAVSTK